MVTLKIFLQKIGPHFIILYWLCGVDPVYLCILGGVCLYIHGGRVGKRMVKLFITSKKCLKILKNGRGLFCLFV